MIQIISGLDVFFVGVQCPLEILEQREKQRGDRHAGDAAKDLQTVHSFLPYDFEVDSREPVEANATKIVEAWQKRGSGRVFLNLNK